MHEVTLLIIVISVCFYITTTNKDVGFAPFVILGVGTIIGHENAATIIIEGIKKWKQK